MRFNWPSFVLITLMVAIYFQHLHQTEAKKIKLKDLKKIKKYAYLLATQRKKFYAIPVPLPLPVFVKRQQIYTQIPVLPRYVQQAPQSHYASQHYQPQQHYQAPSHSYQGEQSYQASDNYAVAANRPPAGPYRVQSLYQPISQRGRYLTQLASALNQAYPSVLGSPNAVMGKLLSGQAKVLAPSQIKGLLFNSKSAAQYASELQQEKAGDRPDSSADAGAQLEGKSNATAKAPEQSDKASESHPQLVRAPGRYPYPAAPTDPFAISASDHYYRPMHYAPLSAAASPFLMAADVPGLLPRHPLVPGPYAAGAGPADFIQLVANHQAALAGANLVEQAPAPAAVAGAEQEQMQLQESKASEAQADKVAEAAASGQLAKRELDRQEALHAALIRQRIETQLAEANSLALAAHQLGLADFAPNHLSRLVNY